MSINTSTNVSGSCFPEDAPFNFLLSQNMAGQGAGITYNNHVQGNSVLNQGGSRIENVYMAPVLSSMPTEPSATGPYAQIGLGYGMNATPQNFDGSNNNASLNAVHSSNPPPARPVEAEITALSNASLDNQNRDMDRDYEYDVALSFAGEDRSFVEQVAHKLRDNHIRVFYDINEQSHLWGQDLSTLLTDIYKNQAKYTIMFISDAYKNKLWSRLEARAAQARAFEQGPGFILPARLDNTPITEVLPTIGHLNADRNNPDALVSHIIEKLKPQSSQLTIQAPQQPPSHTSNGFNDPELHGNPWLD
jgi:hypothetical protein